MAKKGNQRRRTKQVWLRKLNKLKNRVKDLHHKLALWLCENYSVILIPRFQVLQMVKRGGRKLHVTTIRRMMAWSHYSFRQLLKTKAELYNGVRVVECYEPYTSKTCGQCGELNQTLGSSKLFKCKHCKYEADRDLNGTRNILLRYLSLFCKPE